MILAGQTLLLFPDQALKLARPLPGMPGRLQLGESLWSAALGRSSKAQLCQLWGIGCKGYEGDCRAGLSDRAAHSGWEENEELWHKPDLRSVV